MALDLKDTRDWQSVAAATVRPAKWISIEITGVYPGYKYADTAISELRVR